MDLLTKVKNTISKYQLLDSGDKVLVGVSGGPDSIALVHILKQVATEYNLQLHIAHLDHCLRGLESTADAEFVKQIASQLKIAITTVSRQVKNYQQQHNLSLEDAARQVRYDFFLDLLKELNFDKLALGHHANDQAETILMKFLRGSGLKGLGGMEPKKSQIIRPLIELKKEEIKQYCIDHNLKWRIDSTNQEKICLRNKVRLDLLPQLKEEYNQNLINNLNQMGQILRDEDDFLRIETRERLLEIIINSSNHKLVIDKGKFLDLHVALQRRIIREIYKRLTSSYEDLYFANVQEVMQLIKSKSTGVQKGLPGKVLVKLSYQQIIFMLPAAEKEIDFFFYQLKAGEKVEMPELDIIVNTKVLTSDYPWRQELSAENKVFFDLDKIGDTFKIRQRRSGDSFQPLGMSGTKKLKDFFIDQKIPRSKRDETPIFVTATGNVFGVGQLRINDKYKITNQTDEILMIEIMKLSKED